MNTSGVYVDSTGAVRGVDGPCLRTFPPRTCRVESFDPAVRQRSPIDHTCYRPRAFPHVCRCWRGCRL